MVTNKTGKWFNPVNADRFLISEGPGYWTVGQVIGHVVSAKSRRPREDPLARAGTSVRSQLRGPVYAGEMKVAEILRLLQQEGWFLVAQRGSHRQFKHEFKPGRVTVPGKPSDDLAPGTQNSILKQAGLK